jgi:hypothetical protein
MFRPQYAALCGNHVGIQLFGFWELAFLLEILSRV